MMRPPEVGRPKGLGAFSRRKGLMLITAALVLWALIPYAQVRSFEFLTWDDPLYVTHNLQVQSGLTWKSIQWCFTTTQGGNYQPLVWLSHCLSRDLFGNQPAGHHLVNVLFHLINTVLLFRLLLEVTGDLWPSAFVACVFAVHPLHVESVAWVSGRKDVLSFCFWLLATGAYFRYVRRPSPAGYFKLLTLFLLGLLCKPVLVTLPVTLLLLDVWPLGRLRLWGRPKAEFLNCSWALVREKLPLLVVAALFGSATIWAQRQAGAMPEGGLLGMPARAANAAISVWAYLQQMFWPVGLSPFYTHPGPRFSRPLLASALGIILTTTLLALRHASRRPYLVQGWCWFLLTLLPMLGFITVGAQAHADRYMYVPMTGLLVALAWSGQDLSSRWPKAQSMVVGAGVVAVLFFTGLAYRQVGFWKDTTTLFRHALQLDPDNPVAHEQLGHQFRDKGRWAEAVQAYGRSVAIRGNANRWFNLADALQHLGRKEGAIACYQRVLQLDPVYLGAEFRLAVLLGETGRTDAAIDRLRAVIAVNPIRFGSDAGITRDLLIACRLNLGILLKNSQRLEEAVSWLRDVLVHQPGNSKARVHLSQALSRLGRHEEAIRVLKEVAEGRPAHGAFHYFLGLALVEAGRLDEAQQALESVARNDPFAIPAKEQLIDLHRRRNVSTQPRVHPGKGTLSNSKAKPPCIDCPPF